VQAFVRLAAGGDGASPLPAATKAAAVGLGALALAGGGAALPHAVLHDSTGPRHSPGWNRAAPLLRHVASPAGVTLASPEDGSGRDAIGGEHARPPDGSRGGNGDRSGGTLVAAPVIEPPTSNEGRGGGGSSGSGSRDTTATTAAITTLSSSRDGSNTSGSGSHSGPDDGSGSVTTTTTSSGSDSGSGSTTSSDGHGGSDGHG